MKRQIAVGLVLAAWCAETTLAGEVRVNMSVTEPDGVARRSEHISGGIPLPKGLCRPGDALTVVRPDGQVLSSQALPLATDTDGSIRWLLVDFQDDLAAGATNKYELRSAAAGKPAAASQPVAPLKVTNTDDAVTIDTGRIALTISKTRPFTLFDGVSAGGKSVLTGGEARYTDGATGQTHTAGAPAAVEVEHSGPMRVTVAVRGRFVGDDDSRLGYVARITAWAGSSKVHVKYALANSNPEHYSYRSVSDSSIVLKPAGAVEGCWLGADKPTQAGPKAWIAQALSSGAAGCAMATDGDKEVWSWQPGKGAPAGGWIATRGAAPVWVCDLYFADDPARKLALADGSLVLSGVFERWRNTQMDRSGKDAGRPYNGTARALYDCSHLTSQYVFDFTPPAGGDELAALARPARSPVQLFATPKWYLQETDTSPLGAFADQEDELACYKTWGWAYDDKDIPTKPARQVGRYLRTHDNHYDPEEDCLNQLLIMYMRTGKRSYLDNVQTWANFWMDTIAWRTDGWQWKDGGVWWRTGPKGNRPQRPADPRTGVRNYTPGPEGSAKTPKLSGDFANDSYYIGDSKTCYCHNWGEGLLAWYFMTGDRDALEAVMDRVEQDYDTQGRAFGHAPNTAGSFARDFNRSSFLAHAVRMMFPADAFVRQASEFFAQTYLTRTNKEPRGLVNAAGKVANLDLSKLIGEQGIKALADSGNTFDAKTGTLTDKAGHKWTVINEPHTWMHPPASQAMDLYWRVTGNEDARDFVIAYGEAAAKLIYQRHGWLSYGAMLMDFPSRGVGKDYAAWVTEESNAWAEGISGNGFLARFHPDVCARAYALCGEPLLKQRAKDFWNGGSHRGYNTLKMMPLDRVGMWVNYISTHDGELDYVGRTFYVWSHDRTDTASPAAVTDLKVTVEGDKATVTFTAPTDAGGKVVSYQVKCSDRPIVDYDEFLKRYNAFEDDKCCNWWMAGNLSGEPVPAAAGKKESFVVTGAPAGAKYFAVRSFDDSNNRSAMSNVAQSK